MRCSDNFKDQEHVYSLSQIWASALLCWTGENGYESHWHSSSFLRAVEPPQKLTVRLLIQREAVKRSNLLTWASCHMEGFQVSFQVQMGEVRVKSLGNKRATNPWLLYQNNTNCIPVHDLSLLSYQVAQWSFIPGNLNQSIWLCILIAKFFPWMLYFQSLLFATWSLLPTDENKIKGNNCVKYFWLDLIINFFPPAVFQDSLYMVSNLQN